jgi:hypothetical protein
MRWAWNRPCLLRRPEGWGTTVGCRRAPTPVVLPLPQELHRVREPMS